MRWRKLGCVFAPDHNFPWMVSHASNPVAQHLQDDIFRIYFSCRDDQNRSFITSLDISVFPSVRILSIWNQPLLEPGVTGSFDDSGVSISCILPVADQRFLYYVGWNLGVTVPWRNSIGLATAHLASEEFERYSPAPVLDRDRVDPFSLSYPFVLQENGAFRMWYGSNLQWGKCHEDMMHVIKYAESEDGIRWKRDGHIAISLQNDEIGISRPFVLKESSIYKMWYSYRSATYQIGYAESADGLHWKRQDQSAGIEPSSSGWDSEMIEYPFLFDHKMERYMLYCGNGYGKTGFGLAVRERE